MLVLAYLNSIIDWMKQEFIYNPLAGVKVKEHDDFPS